MKLVVDLFLLVALQRGADAFFASMSRQRPALLSSASLSARTRTSTTLFAASDNTRNASEVSREEVADYRKKLGITKTAVNGDAKEVSKKTQSYTTSAPSFLPN